MILFFIWSCLLYLFAKILAYILFINLIFAYLRIVKLKEGYDLDFLFLF